MMENPFKFGSLVDVPYFTDRVKELDYIVQFLKSENHLILMIWIMSVCAEFQQDRQVCDIIRTEQYEIEDPFFKEWILKNVVRG